MSVIVRGMEMPKSCLNCFLSRSGCRAVLKRMRAMEAGTWIPANYRHDDCPLVPVPKHGDLIDREALKAKQQEDADLFKRSASYGDRCRRDEAMNAVANIVNAPTIIPASEEGKT